MPLKFAYYCSGHGYGHATRVSAFASALLELLVKPQITIISSAPKRVFAECINRGAQYRQADIDPVVIQPVAYTVDRWQSVEALRKFLEEKDNKLAAEVVWLFSEKIDCVLSDAAFLGCEAATKACIPSILITNFTFDSVYSYLAVPIKKTSILPSTWDCDDVSLNPETDIPVPIEVLEPLVSQLEAGYRHADALILLPGHIPIPSFFRHPPLPASDWIDLATNRLLPELRAAPYKFSDDLHASLPFPTVTSFIAADSFTVEFPFRKKPNRLVKRAPLLVRPTSADMVSNVGKRRLLSSIGIPDSVQDQPDLRILVVSFGGQAIPRPHRRKNLLPTASPKIDNEQHKHSQTGLLTPPELPDSLESTRPISSSAANNNSDLAPCSKSIVNGSYVALDQIQQSALLPSASWIAIVCGVPSKWTWFGADLDDAPPGFYFAPSDIYMPDLTAIADVLLGKLGYGTVSECIAQGTPLLYVPRLLFVEEHGLRQWLEAEGAGLEMSQEEYELGLWAKKIQTAYELCRERKRGIDHQKNNLDIRQLANWVVNYVETWQRSVEVDVEDV